MQTKELWLFKYRIVLLQIMGCTLFCSSMLSGSMKIDVSASADILWGTLTDVHNIPSFINNMHSVHVDNSANGADVTTGAIQEGSIIRFVRDRGYEHMKSKRLEMEYRVTIMSKSKEQYVLSAGVKFGTTQKQKRHRGRDGARTGTYTIYPLNKNTCRLVWTFAAAPDGWYSCILRFFFGKFFVYLVKRTVRSEMKDFAKEAVRRQLEVAPSRVESSIG